MSLCSFLLSKPTAAAQRTRSVPTLTGVSRPLEWEFSFVCVFPNVQAFLFKDTSPDVFSRVHRRQVCLNISFHPMGAAGTWVRHSGFRVGVQSINHTQSSSGIQTAQGRIICSSSLNEHIYFVQSHKLSSASPLTDVDGWVFCSVLSCPVLCQINAVHTSPCSEPATYTFCGGVYHFPMKLTNKRRQKENDDCATLLASPAANRSGISSQTQILPSEQRADTDCSLSA